MPPRGQTMLPCWRRGSRYDRTASELLKEGASLASRWVLQVCAERRRPSTRCANPRGSARPPADVEAFAYRCWGKTPRLVCISGRKDDSACMGADHLTRFARVD